MNIRKIALTVLGVLALALALVGAFYFGMVAQQRGLVAGLPVPGLSDSSNGQSVLSKRGDSANSETRAQRQYRLMIQSYMQALAQANFTGNFSVLHALGAPSFQRNNPPQKLAAIFAPLRQQRVDLTALIVQKPVLTREPWRNDKNMLRLTGYYPTKPKRVQFDLTLEPVSGVWRLFGLSVNAVPVESGGTAKK